MADKFGIDDDAPNTRNESEADGFESTQQDIRERLLKHAKHTSILRWAVSAIALLALILLAALQIHVLLRLLIWGNHENVQYAILAISPIVSFTVIIATALIAAFRKSSDSDSDLAKMLTDSAKRTAGALSIS